MPMPTVYQRGFTLVELAIVLIIIGLLIGGTLKGQELINGARATATVSQIRAMEAGALTFLDTYKGFPGDLRNATVKLPDCTGDCAPTSSVAGGEDDALNSTQTVGNGAIDFAPGNDVESGQENVAFFVQMFSADLMDGIDGTTPAGGPTVGKNILGTKLGSGSYWRVGYIHRPSEMPNTGATGVSGRVGHFLLLVGKDMPFQGNNVGRAEGSLGGPVAGVNVPPLVVGKGIPVVQAQRIDTKYDDGNPNTGNVMAINRTNIGTTMCATGTAGNNDYATFNRGNDCAIYARFAP